MTTALKLSITIPLDPEALEAEGTIRGMNQVDVIAELRERVGLEMLNALSNVHGVADGTEIAFGSESR